MKPNFTSFTNQPIVVAAKNTLRLIGIYAMQTFRSGSECWTQRM